MEGSAWGRFSFEESKDGSNSLGVFKDAPSRLRMGGVFRLGDWHMDWTDWLLEVAIATRKEVEVQEARKLLELQLELAGGFCTKLYKPVLGSCINW